MAGRPTGFSPHYPPGTETQTRQVNLTLSVSEWQLLEVYGGYAPGIRRAIQLMAGVDGEMPDADLSTEVFRVTTLLLEADNKTEKAILQRRLQSLMEKVNDRISD